MKGLNETLSEGNSTAFLITGVSGAGKSYAIEQAAIKVSEADSYGTRRKGKWVIDWRRAWREATPDKRGNIAVAGVSSNMETVLRDIPEGYTPHVIIIRPTVKLYQDIQRAKIRDSDPSLPKSWTTNRLKAINSHEEATRQISEFERKIRQHVSAPITVVTNHPTGAVGAGWHTPGRSPYKMVGFDPKKLRVYMIFNNMGLIVKCDKSDVPSVKVFPSLAAFNRFVGTKKEGIPWQGAAVQVRDVLKGVFETSLDLPKMAEWLRNHETGEERYVAGKAVVKKFSFGWYVKFTKAPFFNPEWRTEKVSRISFDAFRDRVSKIHGQLQGIS